MSDRPFVGRTFARRPAGYPPRVFRGAPTGRAVRPQWVVDRRSDGWSVQGADGRPCTPARATAAEAIADAHVLVRREGGGELVVRDAAGRISRTDTIARPW